MSANPWERGCTEYAQERGQSLFGWREATRVANPANRRSQANLARLRAIAEADAAEQGRWEHMKVAAVRPDGVPVVLCLHCSRQEAAGWRKDARWLVARRHQALLDMVAATPALGSPPPERVTGHQQEDGDSAAAQTAQRLAAWWRGYLCGAWSCQATTPCGQGAR